jgi:hypothetical protein
MSKVVRGREADSTLLIAGRSCFGASVPRASHFVHP